MLTIRKLVCLAVFIICAVSARGQLDKNKPHLGYLYPAGAQRGTTVQVIAGGQFLRGAKEVYVSGEGVSARVVQHFRMFRNLNSDQRKELQKRLTVIRNQRLAELPVKKRVAMGYTELPTLEQDITAKPKEKKEKKDPVKLPEHPLLNDLEDKSLQELAHIAYCLQFPRKMIQPNRQLGEMALLEITVEPDAEPGTRELRINTANGLTNPIIFQVGLLPEHCELEPNDSRDASVINYLFKPGNPAAIREHLKADPLTLPVLLNGQIMPGDTDRFRFHAKTGQSIVIETQARTLIPYLADAVPGWFQATVALYNAAGDEMTFADDYRFHPDPVVFYKIPRDGIYKLEIRDAIYRGRQDFVYRIAIGELPFITQMFPLGGPEGIETEATIDGWNLPANRLTLNTKTREPAIQKTRFYNGKTASNSVPYAVGTLAETNETEQNDTIADAQKTTLGTLINGRIGKADDIDVFAFEAGTDETIVAEVYARRLNSPLDSILRLTDHSGNVLKWNDDHVLKDSHLHKDPVGLTTHHADSYLMAAIPKKGTYYIHLADSQNYGSDAHGYRLRLTKAQPDFALRVVPSSLHFTAGQTLPITIHVMRKDGFDGEIEVALKDSAKGFNLNGGRIPPGRNRMMLTLTAPLKSDGKRTSIELEGKATVAGKSIQRTAVPADDVMQAFLYRHLVPAQELFATVRNVRWTTPKVELACSEPVRIPAGDSVQVKLKIGRREILNDLQLSLYQPPEGITLENVDVIEDGFVFELKAEKDGLPDGFKDNLILEIHRESPSPGKGGKRKGPRRNNWTSLVQAVRIQVVRQDKKADSDAIQSPTGRSQKSRHL